MNTEPQDRPCGWFFQDRLSWLLPILFVVAVAVLCWRLSSFEFDPDEGGNLMKALLVNHGHPLYAETWSDQPPLFTHALALLFRIAGPSVAGGRGLVMVFSGLLLWGAYQYLRATSGTAAAVGGLALIVSLPRYVMLSFSVMIGLPALALAMLALAALAHWRRRGSRGLLALSAALLAFSVLIKGFTLVLLPAFAAGMLLDQEIGCPRRRLAMLLLWLSVFSVVTVAVVCLLVTPRGLGQLLNPHLVAREVAFYKGITLALALKPARNMFILATAGILLAWSRKNRCALYPAFWALAAGLVLFFHRPVWTHQHLLVSLPAALLAAEVFTAGPWLKRCLFVQGVNWRRRTAAVALSVAAAAMIGGQIRRTYRATARELGEKDEMLQSEDWRLTATMVRHAGATRWVVTDRPMYAFRAHLMVPPEMAVVSEKRLLAGFSGERWLLACVERYRPEQVILARFPWPGVRPYLATHFELVRGRMGRCLFLRPGLTGPFLPDS